jgi:undecaprenyl-phosphate 4-deoxy-4-formamido-L-arabinose transferase
MGVILFGIGLVGEYVGRIHQQVRARPRYVVQTVLQQDDDPPKDDAWLPLAAAQSAKSAGPAESAERRTVKREA